MGKIFVNQTKLTIQVSVGANIADASSASIMYRKPTGVLGSFVATISDSVSGVIFYDIQNSTDINEVGDWRFWAKIDYVGGTTILGEASVVGILAPGSI